MLYYSTLLRGYSKRPIIDPATVQLQNNCTVVGSYAHRLYYSANNRCTISIGTRVAVLFGNNSTSDARTRTRRSRVLFVALRVLLIPNSTATRAITC